MGMGDGEGQGSGGRYPLSIRETCAGGGDTRWEGVVYAEPGRTRGRGRWGGEGETQDMRRRAVQGCVGKVWEVGGEGKGVLVWGKYGGGGKVPRRKRESIVGYQECANFSSGA